MDPISILRKGARTWNEWRKANETGGGMKEVPSPKGLEFVKVLNFSATILSEVDMRGADFSGLDLSGINLSGMDLSGTNFSGANLNNAQLFGTNFQNAHLSKTDFTTANLYSANFSGARLPNSILIGAELRHSKFISAYCQGAVLNKAKLVQSDLTYADFSAASLEQTQITGATGYGVDFSNAYMRGALLSGSFFDSAILVKAFLQGASLDMTWLPNSYLTDADLSSANLLMANFSNADLTRINLFRALLEQTDFTDASLEYANLEYASLIKTNLNKTVLSNCHIYGISAWGLTGEPKDQTSLVITSKGETKITVDDLQIAQFIYLILDNKKIRNVIETVTSKAVLILGRFTEERKQVLDALCIALRKRNYLPILFDFDKPKTRDITETISTLAHLARFIIADITDAKSIPQELQIIIPDLPSVPVLPILLSSQNEYGMFEHFKRYSWVLETYFYSDIATAIDSIRENIITPLEKKIDDLKNKNC
jgi:uncharacterized protein YjbI with pentapeptide repeats